MEKESLQRISQIEDEMHLATEKSKANAEFYRLQQEAEINKILHTPEFLELKKYEALTQNTKVYFGSDIPQTYLSLDGISSIYKAGTPESGSEQNTKAK